MPVTAVYKTSVPETHLFDRDGPALTYYVEHKPYGHVLSGSDGTVTANVRFDVWTFDVAEALQAMETLRLGIAPFGQIWGNGTLQILSAIHMGSSDGDNPPKAGSDKWIRHNWCEYQVKYRCPIPYTATGISATAGSQFFEQALLARLRSLTSLTALVANRITRTNVPEMTDLANGPALTYTIPEGDVGHQLGGYDGTVKAHVQLYAWAYSASAPKLITEAIRLGIDGTVEQFWGDGSVEVISCFQVTDMDADKPPKAGSDQWYYLTVSEYTVRYRLLN